MLTRPMHIAVAQLDAIGGDLRQWTAHRDALRETERRRRPHVTPELAPCGYPPADLVPGAG